MDEEMFELELGDLDLLGLEDACARQDFHSISPKQIQLLTAALTKVKQSKLGIQILPQKEKQKIQKESKKRGRKIDLQRISQLGTRLVESGQYAQLTEFFNTSYPSSQ